MNSQGLKISAIALLFIAALGSVLAEDPSAPKVDTSSPAPTLTLSKDEADSLKCRRQLNMVYGALRKFRQQNGSLPDWLSDLAPEYLHDSEVLECPFIRSSGMVKEWRASLRVFPVYDDPRRAYYGYEFIPMKIPDMPDSTCREFKQRQMRVLGFAVPIVRCLAHERYLNLGFDGTIYKSGLFWENIFVKQPSDENILHAPFTASFPEYAVRRLLRDRPTRLSSGCLDLSNYYNATLYHLSQVTYEGDLIENISPGVQKIRGVDYEIRGLVHLTGRNFPIDFPQAVKGGISVGKQCAQIHLLHGAMEEAPADSVVATYIFHLEDGKKYSMPIVYGKDVETRWFDRDESVDIGNSKAAWVSPADERSTKSLRLYVNSWKNQSPTSKVTSIEFVSGMTPAAPFLLAITAD
jgi:hypothetical protein